MSGRVYTVGAGFDERRNTSRVFPVAPGAGMQLVRDLVRCRTHDWYRWILARAEQRHLHDAVRADGSPAACPVHNCTENGGLVRAVEEELETKQRDELIAAEEAKLAKKGVRIVKFTTPANHWQSPELPKGAIEIRKGGGYDALNLDPATHAKEPCHAVAVRVSRGTRGKAGFVTVCTDRSRHPKAKTGDENWRARSGHGSSSVNREHRELAKVRDERRGFAATVARAKLPKDEHAQLMLDTLISSAHSEVLKIACKLLDLDAGKGGSFREYGELLRTHAAGGAAKQLQVETAIAFGTHEEFLGIYYGWESHAGYLELLERHGYELSPAEMKKLGRNTKAAA